jgi:hypothetical protein
MCLNARGPDRPLLALPALALALLSVPALAVEPPPDRFEPGILKQVM